METVSFSVIGRIRSPFTDVRDMPIQPTGAAGVKGTVEIVPELAEGLADLDGFSHVVLLYCFHQAPPCRLKVTPFLDSEERGVFATRAPARPNPLGLSVVRLVAVRGSVLEVENVDILDGTPLLDVKPYVPAFDHPRVTSTGWLGRARRRAKRARSDDRFERR